MQLTTSCTMGTQLTLSAGHWAARMFECGGNSMLTRQNCSSRQISQQEITVKYIVIGSLSSIKKGVLKGIVANLLSGLASFYKQKWSLSPLWSTLLHWWNTELFWQTLEWNLEELHVLFRKPVRLGETKYVCNASIQEAKEGGILFEATLGYAAKLCPRANKTHPPTNQSWSGRHASPSISVSSISAGSLLQTASYRPLLLFTVLLGVTARPPLLTNG